MTNPFHIGTQAGQLVTALQKPTQTLDYYDVLVVGAGLAGLQCARLLAEAGHSVLLVERKREVGLGVQTTGIFVRKTLEDFSFPAAGLGPVVREVRLYSPKRQLLTLQSQHDEFQVGHMAVILRGWLQDCLTAGVKVQTNVAFIGSSLEARSGGSVVVLEDRSQALPQRFSIHCRYIVGADGAISNVAKDLGLSQNQQFIVGAEQVLTNVPLVGAPHFACFLDGQLSPGYLAWVVHDGEEVHLGVGGYTEFFEPRAALAQFRQSLTGLFDLSGATLLERRGGRIPVGGLLPKLANNRGLLVGDASGAVSPLTAGGLDPCLRLSRLAAQALDQALRAKSPRVLDAYSGTRWRRRFASRLWLRDLARLVRSPLLLEWGCAALRTPLGQRFAAKVFFDRGSFPDVALGQVGTGTTAETSANTSTGQRASDGGEHG
jgi:flavin-dependent dehydrogenase